MRYSPTWRVKEETKWDVRDLETSLRSVCMTSSWVEVKKSIWKQSLVISNLETKVGVHITPQVTWFKYFGSIIQNDWENEVHVNYIILHGEWLKWLSDSCVLCDKKVTLKLKEKFYHTNVRPTMLYGTGCWMIKKP